MAEVTALISKENSEEILSKYLNSKDFTVTTFKVFPFHTLFEGLIGEHYHLQIDYTYKDKALSQKFFLKTLNKNEVMLELSKSINMHEKEKFFYNHLLPEFEKYSIATTFAPKGYLFVDDMMVIEDLSLVGYKGTDKKKPLDLDHCKLCLENLASLHSAAINYEEAKSKKGSAAYSLIQEFPRLLNDKILSGKEDNGASRFFRCSIKGLCRLIDLVPEDGINRDEFKSRLVVALEKMLNESGPPAGIKSSLLHSDLWSSNFLFLYENGKPVTSKLLDYQTLKYGPPQLDVVQFIMTNTRKDFRHKYYNELIEHYYDSFTKLLTKGGLEATLAKSQFVGSCEVFKLPAKIFAAVDRSITFMSGDNYADAVKSNDTLSKLLFEERDQYIVDSYQENEDFRDLLTEDVLELRDLLFPKS